MFYFLALLCSLFCYLNIDPMKSCLFLILSLIFLSFLLSLGNQVWFSYFICMVFLSGIFVILVYFCSLSKYSFKKFNFYLLIFLSIFNMFFFKIFFSSCNLFYIYFYDFVFVFFWIIISLILFLNFTSYFLNFSGALRKL